MTNKFDEEKFRKASRKLCEQNQRRKEKQAETLDNFLAKNGQKLSENLKCVVTGQPLPDNSSKIIKQKFTMKNFESCMRSNGNAFVFYAGFGSKFDGDIILVGLSDEVIEKGLKKGYAVRLWNYM